eukprot:7521035-Pyramimonas_sp.AAC.1
MFDQVVNHPGGSVLLFGFAAKPRIGRRSENCNFSRFAGTDAGDSTSADASTTASGTVSTATTASESCSTS